VEEGRGGDKRFPSRVGVYFLDKTIKEEKECEALADQPCRQQDDLRKKGKRSWEGRDKNQDLKFQNPLNLEKSWGNESIERALETRRLNKV